jgi:hypothetical protein
MLEAIFGAAWLRVFHTTTTTMRRMPYVSATPILSLPVVANAGSCTTNGYNDTKNPLLTDGRYTNSTHYGMASVMFKPHTRVTAQVGYGITSVSGQTPQFDTLQPLGSLEYDYYQPLANVAVDIGHNLTAKAGWNTTSTERDPLWALPIHVTSMPTMRHFPCVGLSE